MTTLIVDGQNGNDAWPGTDGQPLKSIGKALEAVQPGGVVLLRTAVYAEEVRITKANVTLAAEPGHEPVISGGYVPSKEFSGGVLSNVPGDKKSSWVIGQGGNQESLVKITAPGVTLRGLRVEHVAGKGIAVLAGGAMLDRVTVDFCYGSLLLVEDAAAVTVINSTFTRGSMKLFDPNREGAGPAAVQVSVLFKNARNCLIENCLIEYGGGEGVSAGVGSSDITVSRCEIANFNHWHLGSLHAERTRFINCLLWVAGNLTAFQDSGNPSDGIVIGNETGRDGRAAPHQVEVDRCTVMGMKRGLQAVRNGKNYTPTWLVDSKITDNEIYGWDVFGPKSKPPKGVVDIATFDGYPHRQTIMSGNVFMAHSDRPEPVFVAFKVGQVMTADNVWSHRPPAALRSGSDVVGLDDAAVERMRALCVDDIDHTADRITPKRLWFDVMEESPYVPPEPEPEPEPPAPPEPEPPEPPAAGQARIWLEAGWYDVRAVALGEEQG